MQVHIHLESGRRFFNIAILAGTPWRMVCSHRQSGRSQSIAKKFNPLERSAAPTRAPQGNNHVARYSDHREPVWIDRRSSPLHFQEHYGPRYWVALLLDAYRPAYALRCAAFASAVVVAHRALLHRFASSAPPFGEADCSNEPPSDTERLDWSTFWPQSTLKELQILCDLRGACYDVNPTFWTSIPSSVTNLYLSAGIFASLPAESTWMPET